MTQQFIKKRREKCVIFLDDAFGKKGLPERLKQAGYEVQVFLEHFQRGTGQKEQNVKDPRIIGFCDQQGWLLVTTDSDMLRVHRDLIKASQAAILATAHNNPDHMEEWVDGLVKGKARIERHFKKVPRPWFSQFNRQGKITTTYAGPNLEKY